MGVGRKALRRCAIAGAALGCVFIGSAVSRAFAPVHHVHDLNSLLQSVEEEAVHDMHVVKVDARWAEQKVVDGVYGAAQPAHPPIDSTSVKPATPVEVPDPPPAATPKALPPPPPPPPPPPAPAPSPPPLSLSPSPGADPCDLLQKKQWHAYAMFCTGNAPNTSCPFFSQAPAAVWSRIWARGVELVDGATLAEMLDATAIYNMAGDKHKGELPMYKLWAPSGDAGAELIVQEHGHSRSVGGRDEYGLSDRTIGEGQLMVDIGSNLGAVSIRLSAKSPKGHILMVEASPMTYIYQQINLHCNLPPSRFESTDGSAPPNVVSVYGAMSDQDGGTLTFTWDPSQTHTTRTWNNQHRPNVRDITVPTLSFGHLVEQYHLETMAKSIPFFKIDCEGCEYSVIPSFSDEQWDMVQEAHGELHAHAMSPSQKPSKAIIDLTHTRYCHKLKSPPPWCRAEGWL